MHVSVHTLVTEPDWACLHVLRPVSVALSLALSGTFYSVLALSNMCVITVATNPMVVPIHDLPMHIKERQALWQP